MAGCGCSQSSTASQATSKEETMLLLAEASRREIIKDGAKVTVFYLQDKVADQVADTLLQELSANGFEWRRVTTTKEPQSETVLLSPINPGLPGSPIAISIEPGEPLDSKGEAHSKGCTVVYYY